MATVTKDFRVKHGLVVEGTNATVNGSDIITEDAIVGGTQTNITVTYNPTTKVVDFVAENGIADSTTSDLVEGTNLYFTDERAQDAVGNAAGTGISYNDTTGAISVDRSATDPWYDAAGSASDVQDNLDTHTEASSGVHGVTGSVVGTTDTQDLSNKRIVDTLSFSDGVTLAQEGEIAVLAGSHDFEIKANLGDLVLKTVATDSDVVISTTDGDIVLNADGSSYITSASAGNEIATHAYVDNAISGLSWKEAVNLFATDNVPLTGNTETLVVDGHAVLDGTDDGYRLLLTNQTTDTENGLYVYADDGITYTLTRSDDADTVAELVGAAVFVMEGTQYGSTSWVQANHYATTFDNLTWTQFSGSGSVTAGEGISVDGLEIAVDRTTVDTWYEPAGAINDLDTDAIEEGETNLYFTDSRAVTALEAVVPKFTAVEVTGGASGFVSKQIVFKSGGVSDPNTPTISFLKTEYRSAKYLVKIASGTHTELSEILLTLDTSDNIAITEYAVVGTNGSLATISADVSPSDKVRLLITPTNANSTVTISGTLLA